VKEFCYEKAGYKSNKSWDSIEEVELDEIDLKMIFEIQNDPDCHSFE